MTGREDEFQQAINQGHSAAWDQDWERAATHYRKALELSPDNPQALINLGLALFEQQDYEESLRCYLKVIKLTPEDPVPVEKVAQLYQRLGKIDRAQQVGLHAAELYLKNKEVKKAIDNWNRVLRMNPENLQAHARLALIYEHMNEKQHAVHEYLMLASLYQSANDSEKAIRAVNRALHIDPQSPEARQALTLVRDFKPLPKPSRPRGGTGPLEMASLEKADEEDERKEEKLNPIEYAHQKSLTVLASMLFDVADDEQIERVSRRGLQSIMRGTGNLRPQKQMDRTRIMLHLSQSVELQTQGDTVRAADELERAISAGLDHPAAYYNLGLLRAKDNRLDSALRYLQYAVSHPDFALGARLLLGQIQQSSGRWQEAAVEYLEALKLADSGVVPEKYADDLIQLYEPLIEAQSQEKDREALERLCHSISDLLTKADWRDHLRRARMQLPSQTDSGPPIPLAEVLLQTRSSKVVESLSKVFDLERKGYLRSAMEESFLALEYAPTYLPLHAYMGELLLKQGQFQDAINKFVVVALTYSARGEPKRAIDMYRRVISLSPMDLNSRSRLIDQYIALDKIEEALKEYMEFAEVYYSQADLDMARKTYHDALKLAQQSGSETAWRVKILHRIADIDLQSLDWRQALRIYEQIRNYQPDDARARTNLVEINFRLGHETQAMMELDNYLALLVSSKRMQEAVQFLENLVADEPERPHIRRRLAELYKRLGRKDDAIAQLDAAGDLLLAAGDKTGALQVIEAILALNPSNAPEYQQALAKIKSG